MIDFDKFKGQGRCVASDKIECNKIIQDILSCVHKSSLDKYELGRKLIGFFYSECYAGYENKECVKLYSAKAFIDNLHQSKFFAICEYEFGLEKSVVSRLMNVVDEFGDGEKGLKKEFSKYKYSVLVEMLNLSPEERKAVKSDWTVSQVRNYKKSLVATSQQEDEEKIEGPGPKEEYPQFKKWKRNDLCKRIVSLEEEIKKLKEMLEKKGD